LRGNNNNIINEQTTNFTNVDENTLNSKNESKKRKNQTAITKVYLAMSINFLIGYLPNSITPIIFIIGGSDSLIYNYFNILANIIGYLSHSLYIFLFYYFNNDYRETFKKSILLFINIKIHENNLKINENLILDSLINQQDLSNSSVLKESKKSTMLLSNNNHDYHQSENQRYSRETVKKLILPQVSSST
jgi:hypothetical protein